MNTKDILLMTGTISPSKNQYYQSATFSTEDRKFQYLKTLIFYISESNFGKIIFCENSNYEFNKSEIDNLQFLSKLYDKKIELLHFQGNHKKTNKLGYGYGEGECLDYAFDNSELLKNAKTFYKITGRYIIGNINKIIDSHINEKNIFMRMGLNGYFAMNTAFFKMEKHIYKDYFYNTKELVNHSKNINFETAFYEVLYKNNLFKINNKLKILPVRTNYHEDFFPGNMYKFNFMRRPKFRYDYILFNLGMYNISKSDRIFYKLITPITRKKQDTAT